MTCFDLVYSLGHWERTICYLWKYFPSCENEVLSFLYIFVVPLLLAVSNEFIYCIEPIFEYLWFALWYRNVSIRKITEMCETKQYLILKFFSLNNNATIYNSCNKGSLLWYNSFNISYIFCNKHFKAFLELHMSKDKPKIFYLIGTRIINVVFEF